MRNFKKLALVGVFAVVTAFSVTACGSSNGTTQEATTVDSQAEQDSKRAAYREEQSRLAESKAAAAAEAEGTATEAGIRGQSCAVAWGCPLTLSVKIWYYIHCLRIWRNWQTRQI